MPERTMRYQRGAKTGLMGALAIATSFFLTDPASAQSAHIGVAPTTVAAGGQVSVSGTIPTSGPTSCVVPDAAILTSTAALFPPDGFGPQLPRDANGVFQTTYTVPTSTAPGSYTVGVRCGGGNVGIFATLEVTSQGTTVPTSAPAKGRSSGRSGWIVAGVIAALVLIAAFGLAVRGRTNRDRGALR